VNAWAIEKAANRSNATSPKALLEMLILTFHPPVQSCASFYLPGAGGFDEISTFRRVAGMERCD
jgi:hypothetical protein